MKYGLLRSSAQRSEFDFTASICQMGSSINFRPNEFKMPAARNICQKKNQDSTPTLWGRSENELAIATYYFFSASILYFSVQIYDLVLGLLGSSSAMEGIHLQNTFVVSEDALTIVCVLVVVLICTWIDPGFKIWRTANSSYLSRNSLRQLQCFSGFGSY